MSHTVIPNNLPLTWLQRDGWINNTSAEMKKKWEDKYRLGQTDHKSDLGSVTIDQLLTEMENEALDELSYINELRRRMKQ